MGLNLGSWKVLSYIDDTKVLLEKERTKRHQMSTSRDKYLADIEARVEEFKAKRDVLLAILHYSYSERQRLIDREFAQRESLLQELRETLREGTRLNNPQMVLAAVEGIKVVLNAVPIQLPPPPPVNPFYGLTFPTVPTYNLPSTSFLPDRFN